MDWYIVLCLAVLAVTSWAQRLTIPTPFAYPASCADPNMTKPLKPGMPMPPIPQLPATFQTRVEANIVDKQYTIAAEEYYDSVNNRTALRLLKNNTMDYLVFDYANDQIIYAISGVCTVTNMRSDDNTFLFGGNGGAGGIPHAFSTAKALHFARSNGLTYMGQTTIRGINTDHWQSCMYWDALKSNFTLDYYFSVFNWTDPDNSPQMPVRAEVNGKRYSSAGSTQFHHIYEYFDFRNAIWGSDSVFEIPEGVVCPGRKMTRKIPDLPDQFSFREEIRSPLEQYVSEVYVVYDYLNKLVRYDYKPPVNGPPFFTTHMLTEVHDYSTGIRYVTDRSTNNCTITGIERSSFDASYSMTKNGNSQNVTFLKMKTTMQMFFLNKAATYAGKRTVRNMVCDYYISIRSDFNIPGYNSFTSTFGIYFLDPTWSEQDINLSKNYGIPVRLTITTPDWVGYQAMYDIYDFKPQPPLYGDFDITSCFTQYKKQPFLIEFAGTYDSNLYRYSNHFVKTMVEKISNSTNVSQIRVTNGKMQIDANGGHVFFKGTLLDLPPAIDYFRKVPDMMMRYSYNELTDVFSASNCAERCNKIHKPPASLCNSFDFVANTHRCTISQTLTEDGQLVPDKNFDHYIRLVPLTHNELGVEEAYRALKNSVIFGGFAIQVNIDGFMQTFIAKTIESDELPSSQNRITTQELMSQFTVQVNKDMPGYSFFDIKDSIDNCANFCIDQMREICNSFTYNATYGYCTLSTLHPDERPNAVIDAELVNLYSRVYTSGYIHMPGVVKPPMSEAVYQDVHTADMCAKLCNFYNAFNCKSFTYCEDRSVCFLGKTYYYGQPDTSLQSYPVCEHYSRKHLLADFKKIGGRGYHSPATRVVSDINVQQCAKLCVEMELDNCARFDFCDQATECLLSTGVIQDTGPAVKYHPCDVYERKSFPDGSVYFSNPSNCSYAPATSTRSSGVMPGAKVPPVPNLPNTFQTRIEGNIIDKMKTVVAEEYDDSFSNRTALRIIQNNKMDYMIFNYNDNQVLMVQNGVCHAVNMTNDNSTFLFGMKGGPGGLPHVYSTRLALQYAKTNGLAYMGKSTIRGVLTDHWQSCMYWDMLKSNFSLDLYFSVYNWTDPDNSHQVPIRAEVRGAQYLNGSRQFHHVYEYIDFRNRIWGDDSLLETPKGMPCSGRKQTRRVPNLEGQYSYREEIVSPGDQSITQADVWYDYSYKLVRFDYRPAYSAFPYFTTNSVTEVHDYFTGIAYAIDRAQGNCSMIPIQNATFDASVNITTTANKSKQFYVKMKSPSQLFYLDNTTYTYEGKRTVRDMLCDTFISTRSDFKLPNYGNFNSTFEFYFLDQTWQESNNQGSISRMNTDIPIRLVITTPDWVGFQATYNIYDFDAEDPSYNRFDITTCYKDSAKQPFIIEFPGTYDSSMYQYRNQFMKATVDAITRYAHVSHIRVQSGEFHINPNNAYFIGTLLDLPPPSAYYRKLPGMFMRFSNDETATLSSASDCAMRCNNPQTITNCNSFDYCPSQNLCTLSRTHTEDGSLVSSQGQCDHYSRSVQTTPLEIGLDHAYTSLKNMVLIGNFKIQVNIDGIMQQYTAQTIDSNVILNTQRHLNTKTLMDQFNVQFNKDISGHDDLVLSGLAIDDCASACINHESWICNSFSFIFFTGHCVLSKLHPDERPSLVQNSQMVDLYSRKYTSGYQVMPGLTMLSKSTTIYEKIKSADECAKLCTNYNSFNCKSFDYCDDISTCYLGKTHYYDAPEADKKMTEMCSHYSRKYVADFRQSKRMRLTNTADRIVSRVSVDQCAKLCVEMESASCASFGYCGNTTECRLSTASMKNIGQLTTESNLWCDVYNRESFPDGTPYINNPSKYYSLSAPNTGYSGGAMAGVAIGMLVMGILLAAGVYFGKTKLGKSNPDNMQVAFVNKEFDNNDE